MVDSVQSRQTQDSFSHYSLGPFEVPYPNPYSRLNLGLSLLPGSCCVQLGQRYCHSNLVENRAFSHSVVDAP